MTFAPDHTATNRLARPTIRKSKLDPEVCWQAVHSRDRRFDGRFFAGITTTRVYCRSICPVSFGRPANIRWYPSAVEAEAAGFRPCKRCRPRTSPKGSAWRGTSAVVSRALMLISQGALDNGNLERLAKRMGIVSRHLRRLFDQHLGLSPLKIARSHRVHVARNLILRTKLPFTGIASRTGFKSIRQFNHSVRTAFGRSPTMLRLLQGELKALDRDTGFVVHLSYCAPFDWSSLIEFLKGRATPGVEAVEDNCYRRTIEIRGRVGAIEVWHDADHARLATRIVLPSCDCLMHVVRRVRRMFDVEADAVRIGQHLSQDARLAKMLVKRPGLRVPGVWDGFELAVRAVLGQQLSVVDAPLVVERLVRAFGQPVQTAIPGLSYLFPRPGILAEANLKSLGVTADQTDTIRSIAHAVLDGKLIFNSREGLRHVVSRLPDFRGLNQGIASYIAMRVFGEPDSLPYTDRGLRRALGTHGRPVSPTKLLRSFERLKPWRAYAAMHFWAAMQQTSGPNQSPFRRAKGGRKSRRLTIAT
jgi:AraC family transcriptional regulator, regulatory protein of adaptative response / DNA-3-methyladenine glycosylase II